jgi:hypothetical protein
VLIASVAGVDAANATAIKRALVGQGGKLGANTASLMRAPWDIEVCEQRGECHAGDRLGVLRFGALDRCEQQLW